MADRLTWVRADMQPVAECQTNGCNWITRASFYTAPRAITEQAKRHARNNPGHFVIMDRITRTSYIVPTDKAGSDDDES